MSKQVEWLVGTDHDELLRLRFSRLKSKEIAYRLLIQKANEKGSSISDELLQQKAKGLSSAIDSALNYWDIAEKSLNARVLSRYYAFLQFTIAEQVASINNTSDLKEAQKYTEQGHGLSTLNLNNDDLFMDNYYCYIRSDGHFFHYLKHLNTSNLNNLVNPKKLKKDDKDLRDRTIASLSDLFRRIPELHNVIEECTGHTPLTLNIGYNTFRNHEVNENRREEYSKKTGTFQFHAPKDDAKDIVTYINIYPSSDLITCDFIQKLKTPFIDFMVEKDNHSNSSYFTCSFLHKNEGVWWDHIKSYKSSYTPSLFIVPLFDEIQDPVVINYMLMYTLSIIVRYLPDIWYEITQGKYSNIGSLIEYYISIFDHTVPHIMLERITGTKLNISAPGDFNAPV